MFLLKNLYLHTNLKRSETFRFVLSYGLVVQLVRIPACHAGGRGFESRPDRKKALQKGGFFCATKLKAMFHVYVLYSTRLNSFYKGHTSDLTERLKRHSAGREQYTKKETPWILVWSVQKTTKSDAYKFELKLKNLSRKRMLEFMLKYETEVAGSDELLLIKQLSEC